MFSRLLLFALLTLSISLAQSPLGNITGVVSDPAGSVVPNSEVVLKSLDTGIERRVQTDNSGVYNFPNLIPGNYKVSATAAGFRPLETEAIALAAFRTARQDLRLEIQSASTEVTVREAVSGVIQLDSPAIATSLNSKQILELPTNLRSVFNNAGDSGVVFQMMPLTIPGVQQVGAGAAWIVPGSGGNGVRLKVDGIETNFGNFGTPDPVTQPSMESLAEFTGNVMTNRAEFGGIGTITSVTKSGTNDVHGSVFWYARNSVFDARNAFLTTKPFQNIHNFGAAFGGPIKRDKTFFHITWDEVHGSRAYAFISNVPTLAQREGIFTGTALRNPYTPANNPIAPGGDRILPSAITSQAREAMNMFYPLPNFGAPDLVAGNYRAAYNGPETHRILEGRFDHNWTSGHSSFARYQFKNTDYDIPGARSELPPISVGTSTNNRNVHFATLGDIAVLRPNIVNEFRAGFVALDSSSTIEVTGDATLQKIGISGLPPRGNLEGIPNISVVGLSTVTQRLLNPVVDGRWQFADNLSWNVGAHQMKFGAEYVRWFVNRYLPVQTALYGNFSFTNRFSGHPFADFLLGLPTQVSRIDPFPTQYTRWNNWSFYAQDDWKVTPRLTFSYGLRYEYNGAATLRHDNIYSFDLASGAIVIPNENARKAVSPYLPSTIPVINGDQAGYPRALRNTDLNNFAPRFGFSYQPFRDARTVIRGGWGIYYAPYSGAVTGALSSGPFAISTTSNNAIVNGVPQYTFANPFASPGAASALNLSAMNPDLVNAYTMQYSFSVEREVVRDLGVRVSYLGSKGTQLVYQRNINQPPASTIAFSAARRPYPLYNNIVYADNGANLSYSGLQVQVTKRFSQGLQVLSTWIWAKQLSEVDDTGNAELNTQIEDAYDRRRDRADVYSVPRHQWMNQVLYELPFLRKNPVLGGWQVNALLNLSTGHFLNPLWPGADTSNTNNLSARPDVLGPVQYPETIGSWYDRSVYARPENGRFGNAARNSVVGPGYVIANFGFSKEFRTERFGAVQVGASFQNILNHVNLGQPNMNVNNAAGGTITSTHIFPAAGSPRTGQLSLRWNY
jgi:hypothetical protein